VPERPGVSQRRLPRDARYPGGWGANWRDGKEHAQLHSGTVVAVSVPHPLPDSLVDLIAARFRVIGEPMRIKLLDALREGPSTVGELTSALGASQQNVSKHLNVLHQAGIVRRAKEGTSVRYSIADESVFELCEQVCGGLRRQLDELGAAVGRVAA
jgi:DNA-binding transcriptional ArsR family regulator